MTLTTKQYGYVVQALAETSLELKRSGNAINAKKALVTVKKVLTIKDYGNFDGFKALDEEQLILIAEALEDRAKYRELFGTRYDATMMRQTAELIRVYKRDREAAWIKNRFEAGIA